jgi:DNA-binding GntR family transcriptional regulator
MAEFILLFDLTKINTQYKLFLADHQPVILTYNYLPTKIITLPYQEADLHRPLYEFLLKFCRQELAYYFSEIVPLTAPAWLVKQLDLPLQKTALFCFEEIGYNQNNEPIIKFLSYFRDDLLRLRLMRRQRII